MKLNNIKKNIFIFRRVRQAYSRQTPVQGLGQDIIILVIHNLNNILI
jgi:hypothetical protein